MDSSFAGDRKTVVNNRAEILELQRRIVELSHANEAAQWRLHAYRFPVLTLPSEIVSEIFTHTLPPYPECPSQTGPFSPTSLSHICSKWREIALGTPRLWTAIAVSSPTLFNSASKLGRCL
ncbi:F-box domain-containing protein [Favolaschia claudopus]|uniref:F-box domain-containing protein n=1 Tax=Favolaschia claudopus TaxID=2862362 RepID=A0AAW0BHI2_9AGAR